MQVPPWQHPVGQLVASQLPVHEPPSHWPAPHDSHAAPERPHDRLDCAVTHMAPMQQPFGHVVALQVDVTQTPPLQAVAPQSAHARPPMPHVDGDCIVTH